MRRCAARHPPDEDALPDRGGAARDRVRARARTSQPSQCRCDDGRKGTVSCSMAFRRGTGRCVRDSPAVSVQVRITSAKPSLRLANVTFTLTMSTRSGFVVEIARWEIGWRRQSARTFAMTSSTSMPSSVLDSVLLLRRRLVGVHRRSAIRASSPFRSTISNSLDAAPLGVFAPCSQAATVVLPTFRNAGKAPLAGAVFLPNPHHVLRCKSWRWLDAQRIELR